jgi:hypothetical protein
MLKRVKINLADTLFEHLCHCISESHHKPTVMIHHPRLISELLRQSKLIEVLRTREKLRAFNTYKFDGRNLINLKVIQAKNLITPMHPLQRINEKYFWCDGLPTILEHDNEDVIKNFLEMVREETGHKVDRSMVVAAPDWDVFNNPKEKPRTRVKRLRQLCLKNLMTILNLRTKTRVIMMAMTVWMNWLTTLRIKRLFKEIKMLEPLRGKRLLLQRRKGLEMLRRRRGLRREMKDQ